MCEIQGSDTMVAEDSDLQGCDTVSLGEDSGIHLTSDIV
jgi:hypothetical protein